MQGGTRSQLQLAAVCSKQATTVCSRQAATKSEKSYLHTKNAQATSLQQTMSRKVAATKSCKVAATKSPKVAATKSSKTDLHTKNSQAATVPQLAAAAKPQACCLFAAIHCEKPFISIRVVPIMLTARPELPYPWIYFPGKVSRLLGGECYLTMCCHGYNTLVQHIR